jgi:hypothetical protein
MRERLAGFGALTMAVLATVGGGSRSRVEAPARSVSVASISVADVTLTVFQGQTVFIFHPITDQGSEPACYVVERVSGIMNLGTGEMLATTIQNPDPTTRYLITDAGTFTETTITSATATCTGLDPALDLNTTLEKVSSFTASPTFTGTIQYTYRAIDETNTTVTSINTATVTIAISDGSALSCECTAGDGTVVRPESEDANTPNGHYSLLKDGSLNLRDFLISFEGNSHCNANSGSGGYNCAGNAAVILRSAGGMTIMGTIQVLTISDNQTETLTFSFSREGDTSDSKNANADISLEPASDVKDKTVPSPQCKPKDVKFTFIVSGETGSKENKLKTRILNWLERERAIDGEVWKSPDITFRKGDGTKVERGKYFNAINKIVGVDPPVIRGAPGVFAIIVSKCNGKYKESGRIKLTLRKKR